MIDPSAFRNTGLSDDEAAMLAAMLTRISDRARRNRKLDAYYEGDYRVRNLGISVPPGMERIRNIVGWPTMAVDVLAERVEPEGLAVPSGEDLGLDDLWADNAMSVKAPLAIADTFVYGLNFMAASVGGPGEPDVLLTVEPPTHMTGIWDARTRRLSAAASAVWDPKTSQPTAATLYLPKETIMLERDASAGWVLSDAITHRAGHTLVVPMVHRPRSGRPFGTSRITKAVISYTDAAVRTALGMEVAREFYSAPQRYLLNAQRDAFVDQHGNPVTAWETYMGRYLALTASDDPDAPTPQIGQFAAGSPAPFVDQIEALASLYVSETSVPVSYMGFNTDNPPSGDGSRMLEARLIKAAERCHATLGAAFVELAQAALILRDGALPAPARRMTCRWTDPATPTKAATADAVVKYKSAELLPDLEVAWEMMGLDRTTIDRLVAADRRNRAVSIATSLAAAAAGRQQAQQPAA